MVKKALDAKINKENDGLKKLAAAQHDIYKIAVQQVIEKLKGISTKELDKDLKDYLNFAIKMAMENVDDILEENANDKKFMKTYAKEYNRAKSFNVNNIEKVALLSTIKKING